LTYLQKRVHKARGDFALDVFFALKVLEHVGDLFPEVHSFLWVRGGQRGGEEDDEEGAERRRDIVQFVSGGDTIDLENDRKHAVIHSSHTLRPGLNPLAPGLETYLELLV